MPKPPYPPPAPPDDRQPFRDDRGSLARPSPAARWQILIHFWLLFVGLPVLIILLCALLSSFRPPEESAPSRTQSEARQRQEGQQYSRGLEQAATPGEVLFQIGEGVSGHERRIWKMAVAMAASGYRLGRDEDHLGESISYRSGEAVRFVTVATSGLQYLGGMNDDFAVDVTYWKLNREMTNPGPSFLILHAPRAFDRRMYDAVSDEWTNWIATFFGGELSVAGTDLLDDLWSIYAADRKAGWELRPLGPLKTASVLRSRYVVGNSYHLWLSRHLETYELRGILNSTWETPEKEPWEVSQFEEPGASLTLDFTYCGSSNLDPVRFKVFSTDGDDGRQKCGP